MKAFAVNVVNDSGEKIIGELLLRLWQFEVVRYFSNIWEVLYRRKLPESSLNGCSRCHFSKKRR